MTGPDQVGHRTGSFGEAHDLSFVDRLGTWWSRWSLRRKVGDLSGLDLADIGSGFDARFTRNVLDEVRHATVVDLSLSPDLADDPRITAITGRLPEVLDTLPAEGFDLIVMLSVLEHLDDDAGALDRLHRLLRPGGRLFINVPSWLGKTALEFSAFRLGLSPAEEMNDHRRYYDPRDLWPGLVRAGFLPENITCRRHKLGCNTYAVCRRS